MKKVFLFSAAVIGMMACTKEINVVKSEQPVITVSEPLQFESEEDLISAINSFNDSERTRTSDDGFVSYYETVMQEDGYEDRQNVILSDAFGSVLDINGEVIYNGIMVKVCDYGVLYGPIELKDTIRLIAERNDVLSICTRSRCPYFSNESPDYRLDGYDGIYLVDSFGLLSPSEDNEYSVSTKVNDGVEVLYENGLSLFMGTGKDADWKASFVKPASGKQKVKFSDSKYCNDTKIYQQKYGVGEGNGIKTKTMKKHIGMIWNKFKNRIEAGIIGLVIEEHSTFLSSNTPDVNYTSYAGRSYYVYSLSKRGTNANEWMLLSNAKVLADVKAGQALADANNMNVKVSAVRYVINDEIAITRFPDSVQNGEYEKIEKPWIVPFGGDMGIKNSITGDYNGRAGIFCVKCVTAYGCSFRGDEIRGTKMIYTLNPIN